MGWIFSIALFVAWCITGNDIALIASGVFAIAGEIGIVAVRIKTATDVLSKKN